MSLSSLAAAALLAFHNGTAVPRGGAPVSKPQYLSMEVYQDLADCAHSSPLLGRRAVAANQCFKNSDEGGTYEYSCKAGRDPGASNCTLYSYKSKDCSGTGTTPEPNLVGIYADGTCQDAPKFKACWKFSFSTAARLYNSYTRPIVTNFQGGGCQGFPATVEDLGLCYPTGSNSYRKRCVDGIIHNCQYEGSSECSGNGETCTPFPEYMPGQCQNRSHYSTSSSVLYTC